MKIRKLTSEEFWPMCDKLSPKIFKGSLYFLSRNISTTHEMKARLRYRAAMKSCTELNLGLFDNKGVLVGWSSSRQTRPSELYMVNSAIFPKYRRQGFYSKLLQMTLREAKKLGFHTVKSNHVSTNNAVIIAKLKLGFKVTGFELSDEMGALIQLTYFLNSTRGEVMEFRSGQRKPSKRVKALFKM